MITRSIMFEEIHGNQKSQTLKKAEIITSLR
jgi:hypothetical protein